MKMTKHCIIGKDYSEKCLTTKCLIKDLCRKEHHSLEKEELENKTNSS